MGFARLPHSRLYVHSRLYALTEPDHDPVRRTQLAVQSLRTAGQNVSADTTHDLRPGERPPAPSGVPKKQPRAVTSTRQQRAQAAALSPVHTDISPQLPIPAPKSALPHSHTPAQPQRGSHHTRSTMPPRLS